MADDLFGALDPVVQALEALGVPYYVAGSVASSALGEARTTRDVDLVAEVRAEHADAIAALLQADYYVDAEMIRDAVRRRASFNLLHLPTMFKVDVFVPAGDVYDEAAMARRRQEALMPSRPGRTYCLCAPEDVILSKLAWFRQGGEVSEQQWRDVLGVMKVQGPQMDLAYLRGWAERLGLDDLLEDAMGDAGWG